LDKKQGGLIENSCTPLLPKSRAEALKREERETKIPLQSVCSSSAKKPIVFPLYYYPMTKTFRTASNMYLSAMHSFTSTAKKNTAKFFLE